MHLLASQGSCESISRSSDHVYKVKARERARLECLRDGVAAGSASKQWQPRTDQVFADYDAAQEQHVGFRL